MVFLMRQFMTHCVLIGVLGFVGCSHITTSTSMHPMMSSASEVVLIEAGSPSSEAIPQGNSVDVALNPGADALNQPRLASLSTEQQSPRIPGRVSSKFPNVDLIDQH